MDLIEEQIIKESYIKLVDFLGKAIDRNCEIVLQWINDDEITIIAIHNGELSNRSIGMKMNKMGSNVRELYEKLNSTNNIIRLENGKEVFSNSFYIRNSKNNILGILSVNHDLIYYKNAKKMMDDFFGFIEKSNIENESSPIYDSVQEFTLNRIEEVIWESGFPPDRLTIEERMNILKKLNDRNVFKVKGAVKIVSKLLNTSSSTIYRYLKNIDNN